MHVSVSTVSLTVVLLFLPWAGSIGQAQEPLAGTKGTATSLSQWQNTVTAHLEALAVLETLNADLLSHDSATLTLERWCQTHQMASPAHVIAEKVSGVQKSPTARQRQELAISATEPVRYRSVRLRCGRHVLSEAENWYVPGRLTPAMNQQLQTTDVAFGRVVQPLHFSRHTLDATLLWSPLPADWQVNAHGIAGPLEWPDAGAAVLRHRAVLLLPDGRPISEVVETYTAEVLAFPQPRVER